MPGIEVAARAPVRNDENAKGRRRAWNERVAGWPEVRQKVRFALPCVHNAFGTQLGVERRGCNRIAENICKCVSSLVVLRPGQFIEELVCAGIDAATNELLIARGIKSMLLVITPNDRL